MEQLLIAKSSVRRTRSDCVPLLLLGIGKAITSIHNMRDALETDIDGLPIRAHIKSPLHEYTGHE